MVKSSRDMADELAERWDREASGYESQARSPEYSANERRLLEMHARVKRGCANQLRTEARKITRG